ncbi:hypothetical protein SISNIDRAFT_249223 [Sistotremastrum niveocremeum HHB9708]|uniref:Uncharacterized protein n=1 Tax=Sistotremastrum niveocremeum HHB9708 TaxID=1314777 RepID=A0A164YVY3_9AGAM|nr:hypothetical protein SISNIDRAFT_249223 [Sistotremastrum niveocremeum HHB9708]
MAVMPRTDGLDIPVIPIFPLCEAITPLCMPILPMSRSPLRLPHRHDLEDPVWHEMSSDHATPYIQNMTVELSRFEHDGFPLFSLWTGDKEKSRSFETWWRPYVSIGQKCDHSDLYGQGIRCSMTCRDTLCQLKGPSPPFSERLEVLRSRLDDEPRLQKDLAQLLLNELDARTGRLKERGGPFERNRAMMVRCNDEDPILPLVLLGASCGRRFYLLHHQECWDCACLRMQEDFCTVGIALGTSRFTTCDACLLDTERAEHIALEHGF